MRFVLTVVALLLLSQPAPAHEFTIGDITVTHPFSRATPPTARTGAGYLVLTNNGSEPDRLVAVETAVAESVEFHQTVVKDGMATMTPVSNGFEIPPGGKVVIGDDGLHIMLVGLKQPLREGETIDATLIFEKAGRSDVYFEVEALGQPVNQHQGSGHGG